MRILVLRFKFISDSMKKAHWMARTVCRHQVLEPRCCCGNSWIPQCMPQCGVQHTGGRPHPNPNLHQTRIAFGLVLCLPTRVGCCPLIMCGVGPPSGSGRSTFVEATSMHNGTAKMYKNSYDSTKQNPTKSFSVQLK